MNSPKIKDRKQLKTILFPRGTETRAFWKSYEINIDRYCDKWELYEEELVKKCSVLNSTDLAVIAKQYKIPLNNHAPVLEQLTANTKSAIDFYCVLKFAERSPKVLSRYFGIPIRKNNIDRRQVILKVFDLRMKERLTEIFFMVISQNKGSAKYQFKVHDPKNAFTFKSVEKNVTTLIRYLNRKSDMEYDIRFIDKVEDDYYVLLVKETTDKMVCALPNNIRVQTGQYILIRWHKKESLFSIDTKDYHESSRIKNYMARKTKLAFKYTRQQGTYNPDQFLASILAPVNDVKDLALLDIQVRNTTTGDNTWRLTNNKKKNNILDGIRHAVETKAINLQNFANYKSLTFLYKEISYTVQFRLDRYNHTKLHLIDQKKPAAELAAFKAAFNKKYTIPFDAFLHNEDETEDLIQITRKMVADKTISAEMPQEYEDLVIKLVNDKFIYQPTENGRRRCVECKSIFWTPGDCRSCGTETYFEGDYLDILVNENAFEKYVYKAAAKVASVKIERVRRQIQKTSFPFIELITKEGTSLSIYISPGMVNEKITSYFSENGLPLLIILLKYKDGLDMQIRNRNFECVDFAEIVNTDETKCTALITKALADQQSKWHQKVIDKGAKSFERLSNKPKQYNDQAFERDIYNLLHELFLVADRMGERLTGTKAPDGIACIQNYSRPLRRFCLAWDCKYSEAVKGYSLQEKPAKHRYYLNKLTTNDKVRFFGGLRVYAFITQNMNMTKYTSFYKKLMTGFSWSCQVLLLFEEQILMIYQVYKANEILIQNYPAIYYNRMIPLFTKLPKSENEPYKRISKERIEKIFGTLQQDFKKVHRVFKFKRVDFV
jgi:hypothetical protein